MAAHRCGRLARHVVGERVAVRPARRVAGLVGVDACRCRVACVVADAGRGLLRRVVESGLAVLALMRGLPIDIVAGSARCRVPGVACVLAVALRLLTVEGVELARVAGVAALATSEQLVDGVAETAAAAAALPRAG